jgi:molybdopterin converting factor small subunit
MTNATPSTLVIWQIPAMLRTASLGNGEVKVVIQHGSYKEALAQLLALYPSFADHFDSETGKPRSYISIFHNDEQLTDFSNVTLLQNRDELLIVPALAGG